MNWVTSEHFSIHIIKWQSNTVHEICCKYANWFTPNKLLWSASDVWTEEIRKREKGWVVMVICQTHLTKEDFAWLNENSSVLQIKCVMGWKSEEIRQVSGFRIRAETRRKGGERTEWKWVSRQVTSLSTSENQTCVFNSYCHANHHHQPSVCLENPNNEDHWQGAFLEGCVYVCEPQYPDFIKGHLHSSYIKYNVWQKRQQSWHPSRKKTDMGTLQTSTFNLKSYSSCSAFQWFNAMCDFETLKTKNQCSN